MKQKVFEPYVEKEYLCRNLEMFGNLHLKITVLYMEKQRMIKFTQVGCYSMHCEQTYAMNFNRGPARCISLRMSNTEPSKRYLNMDCQLTMVIDLNNLACRIRRCCAHSAQDYKWSLVFAIPCSISASGFAKL